MPQFVRIFLKDLRRFWPEIAASCAAISAFAWVAPIFWLATDELGSHGFGFLDASHLKILANTAGVLVILAWFVLTLRVVQDESLVGTRMFWITRPYDWRHLLVAKLLFVATFTLLPLLIAQSFMLRQANFNPALHVSGLLYSAAEFSVVILVFFMLATLVASLQRAIITVLVFSAIVAAIAFVVSTLTLPSTSVPVDDQFTTLLIPLICLTVIAVQYSTRRFWLALTLALTSLAVLAILSANPLDDMLIERIFAPNQSQAAIEIKTDDSHGIIATRLNEDRPTEISLFFPVAVSGLLSDDVLTPDDVRITLHADDGSSFTTPWQANYNNHLQTESPNATITLQIDARRYQVFQRKPVTLTLEIASTQLRAQDSTRAVFPFGRQRIPSLGICSDRGMTYVASDSLSCREALTQPVLSRLDTGLFEKLCNQVKSGSEAIDTLRSWTGALDPGYADFNLVPVYNTTINFERLHPNERDTKREVHACLGALLEITPYTLVQRFRTSTVLHDFKLPAPVTS